MAKANIICIDDEREVLAALKKDLASLEDNYTVSECESAKEAWDLMEELASDGEEVALIISDQIMPGENGVEFMTRAYNDPRFKNTKKVMLTGLASHEETIRAINEAHINFYMEKPWDPEELVEKIKVLL